MRRTRVVLGIAALVLVGAACNYPNYRGDAGHSGNNVFEEGISVSNASTLTLAFAAPLPDGGAYPVDANGITYVLLPTKLMAFSAEGDVNCSGTPASCTPLWTASLPATDIFAPPTSAPTVANDVVYVTDAGTLYAYDARGTTNCSGTPRVCQPLWTGAGASGVANVVNDVVYTGSDNGLGNLLAFDAAGSTNCTGTPRVCEPLWNGVALAKYGTFSQSSPAVVNGVVYVASTGALYAFDANGKTDCFGTTPVLCTPLWTAPITIGPAAADLISPAVAGGTAYLTNGNTLYAFDAAGKTDCTGVPTTCSPLWTASGASGSPAVANGTLYVDSPLGISAFDAAGKSGCSGTPKMCAPMWSYAQGQSLGSSPIVANGVLFSTPGFGLYAWDASGTTDCTGTPKVCTPLFSFVTPEPIPVIGDPAVANGVVYIVAGGPFSPEEDLIAFKPA